MQKKLLIQDFAKKEKKYVDIAAAANATVSDRNEAGMMIGNTL